MTVIGRALSANKRYVTCLCGHQVEHDLLDRTDDITSLNLLDDFVDENVKCEECGAFLEVTMEYEIQVHIESVTAKVFGLPRNIKEPLARDDLYVGMPVDLEDGTYFTLKGTAAIVNGKIENIFSDSDENQLSLQLEECK